MKTVALYFTMLLFATLALSMKNPWIKYPLLILCLGDYLAIWWLWSREQPKA